MSPLGLTIDYGPFAFMEAYDPRYTPNLSDSSLRYAYGMQPHIGKWNLHALGFALHRFLDTEGQLPQDDDFKPSVVSLLSQYDTFFQQSYDDEMGRKLGIDLTKLRNKNDHDDDDDDNNGEASLLERMLELMYVGKVDWTLFYRRLPYLDPQRTQPYQHIGELPREFLEVIMPNNEEDNPQQQQGKATAQADEDDEGLNEEWLAWVNDYVAIVREQRCQESSNPGTGSEQQQQEQKQEEEEQAGWVSLWRKSLFDANPRLVLRNYAAQQVISEAEMGNMEPLTRLYDSLKTPFALTSCEQQLLTSSTTTTTEAEGVDGKKDAGDLGYDDEFELPAPSWARLHAGIGQLS
eukprot:CAMPEP_0167787214 /NCGR_PEP_ID=MMETSP0111_2-20121227/9275_1 /TAXON_ID=91324 /ORGANISM="Lotharella globosa, Strain CCCM811" /LENGTH=348 /DNA_ID=CAMNT_0007678785 /DNA_START=54 /DNA_END=1100 /DNA_ORIENTATION=+